MLKSRLAAALACILLSGCFPGDDEQARPQTGNAPNATAAPLPAASIATWVPVTISTNDLKTRMDAKEVFAIYDVRARESWAAEHITGSESMPWAGLEERKKAIPKDRPIVLYCA